MKNFVFFVIFGANLGPFSKTKLHLSYHRRLSDNQLYPLFTLLKIPIHEVCGNFNEKCIEDLKGGKFLFFWSSVSIWTLFFE